VLFHRTPHADAILRGFRDGTGSYGFVGLEVTGVFLSDQPVGPDEAEGDLLIVRLPAGFPLDDYAVVEEPFPEGWRREYLIPATRLNEEGVVCRASVGSDG
jgi:hypothetical protein